VTTLPPGWRWGDPRPDEPTEPLPVSVDPWAGHDGYTAEMPPVEPAPDPTPAPQRNGRRKVFGYVYELFTDDPRDGEHPYAGQVRAPKTIAQRQREHKSRAEVGRFPWKARIIDGPRGRRLLETVYATGDDYYDQQILDQIEALWIDRLKTTHNRMRPVRPRHGDPLPVRPQEKARPVRRRPASPPRRRVSWRVKVFLTFTVLLTSAFVIGLSQLDQPYPWLPWALGLPAGVGFGWRGTMSLLHAGRRLKAWR
jgi:hypothetical protein